MFFKTISKQIILTILFTFNIADYAFPTSIDPAKQYMFYLHDKIIEDQGIPAVSLNFLPGTISKHAEIVLHVGTGHGILYKPPDEWILPTVKRAEKKIIQE